MCLALEVPSRDLLEEALANERLAWQEWLRAIERRRKLQEQLTKVPHEDSP